VTAVEILEIGRVQTILHIECTGFKDGIYTGNQRECADKWLPGFGHESLNEWSCHFTEMGEWRKKAKEEFKMKMEIIQFRQTLETYTRYPI